MLLQRGPGVAVCWLMMAFSMMVIEVKRWPSWAADVRAGLPVRAEAYVIEVGERGVGGVGRCIRASWRECVRRGTTRMDIHG